MYDNPIKKIDKHIVMEKYKIIIKWLVKAMPKGINLINLIKE